MDENRAIELLSKWHEIISPQDCDEMLFWLSSWISEKEQDLTNYEGIVAGIRLNLTETHKSVAKADVYLEITRDYQEMRHCERELRRLKSARTNVKRRYEILCNKATNFKRY